MEIKKSELLLLLGMVENVGERLESAGILETELDKLIQLDGEISDAYGNDSYSRKKDENELLLKTAKSIIKES